MLFEVVSLLSQEDSKDRPNDIDRSGVLQRGFLSRVQAQGSWPLEYLGLWNLGLRSVLPNVL